MVKEIRYRVHFIQVGLAANVSAVLTQITGAGAGGIWDTLSAQTLGEFLGDPAYDIPDGTPVIRLDLTDAATCLPTLSRGPSRVSYLPAGHVSRSIGVQREYAQEPWESMRGWDVAPDVYATVAETVGIVVQHTPITDHGAAAQPGSFGLS